MLLICTSDVGKGRDDIWSVLYFIVELGQDSALFIPLSRLIYYYHICSWKMKCRLAEMILGKHVITLQHCQTHNLGKRELL